MKKHIAMMMAASLTLGSLVSTAAWADIDDKTLVVGFDAEYPPFGYMNNEGEYVGFDLDVARLVCDNLGWELIKTPINWDSKDMELNSGSIDCIWNGFTIQGREDSYTFSSPYVDNSQVVMVKAGSPIKTLADLAGKIVGVQTDTPVQKALSKGGDKESLGATFKQLVVMPNYNQAVQELDMGGVDAVALDVGVAKKKMADLSGRFEILPEIVMSETYGIGFKKGNTALRDEVEATLREVAAEGTMAKLAEKYGIEPASLLLK